MVRLRLQRPKRVYLSGALSVLSIGWVFASLVFFVTLWEFAYASEGIGPRRILGIDPRFVQEIVLLLLVIALSFIAVVALRAEKYSWAGFLQLSCAFALLGHSAIWVTALGSFEVVQPALWFIYLQQDLPPQLMLFSASVLAMFQTSLPIKLRVLARTPQTATS